MAKQQLQLEGVRFGKLLCLSRAAPSNSGLTRWLCLCDCGIKTIVQQGDLRRGHTQSCGCLLFKHGYGSTIEVNTTYTIWKNMLQRCLNIKDTNYYRYGGRGITVDPKWKTFVNFLEDMGERPSNLTLERINNDKGYYKDNCKWATRKEQANNRRPRKRRINNV